MAHSSFDAELPTTGGGTVTFYRSGPELSGKDKGVSGQKKFDRTETVTQLDLLGAAAARRGMSRPNSYQTCRRTLVRERKAVAWH